MLDKCIFRTPLKIIMQNPCVQVKWKPDGQSSEQIQTQSAIYHIDLSVMFLVCCFHTVTSMQSDLCAIAWGTVGAQSKYWLWVEDSVQLAPWKTCPCCPSHQGPPSSCQVLGIGLEGDLGAEGSRLAWGKFAADVSGFSSSRRSCWGWSYWWEEDSLWFLNSTQFLLRSKKCECLFFRKITDVSCLLSLFLRWNWEAFTSLLVTP